MTGGAAAAIQLMQKDVRPKTGGEQPSMGLGNNVKEALARNFARKVSNNRKILEESKQSVTELRNEFMMCLAKVYDNDTKKDGVLGCHRIIQRNCDNPAVLRVVLGALCDRGS